MADIPSARQRRIMSWLREQKTLTIDQLVQKLGVSTMTVHRDLGTLEKAGLVEKVHGGVTLADVFAPDSRGCQLCGRPLEARTQFTLQTEAGEQLEACCPHCGFLLLDDCKSVARVLLRDYLYGRVLNAAQAYFVVDSDVALCCLPSTLCFASCSDAERFQRGFGGQVMDFETAQRHLLAH
jgi:DeoR family transcriptional regulator, copper-sensing transcriptional repressor